MANYQKMYYILFNAMSECCERMHTAMHEAEGVYIDDDNMPIRLLYPDYSIPSPKGRGNEE